MLLKRLFWCSHLPKRSAHPKGAVYLAGLSEQPNKCESVLKALAKWGHRSYCLIQRLLSACVFSRKNMYAGGDNAQMNGDTPHDGGHGGGGHAVGDELKKTGR